LSCGEETTPRGFDGALHLRRVLFRLAVYVRDLYFGDVVDGRLGLVVSCDMKLVEFKRFTYAPAGSLTESWKERKAAEWNATHCNNSIWNDAIRNGWKVALTVTAADGSHASIVGQCR
jgi:hypothetical protein